MSQILRAAGRFTLTSIRNKERSAVCESCLLLRNGQSEFSTQAKMEPHAKFFKRRRWKKKKQLPNKQELHDQLIQMVGARYLQLSGSSGKRTHLAEFELPVEYHRLNRDSLRLGHQQKNVPPLTETPDLLRMDNAAIEKYGTQSANKTGVQFLDSLSQNKFFEEQNHSDLNISITPKSEAISEFSNEGVHTVTKGIGPHRKESRLYFDNQAVIQEHDVREQKYELDRVNDKVGINEQKVIGKTEFDQNLTIPIDYQQDQHPNNRKQSDLKSKREMASVHKKEKQSHRKKRLKAALNEVYGRKNKKIYEKKEKLKSQNGVPKTKSLLSSLHSRSKFKSDIDIADGGESVEAAKKMFVYKPDEMADSELNSSDPILEVLFEKDIKETEVDELVTKVCDIEESCDELNEDNVNDKHSIGEGASSAHLPDAEWAVIKAIRKKKKDVTGLSVDEMEKLEMIQDVFHEDTTFVDNLPVSHAVSDWAEDVRPIEGYITKRMSQIIYQNHRILAQKLIMTNIKYQYKAQKKQKEKQNQGVLRKIKVDEDLMVHTKQEIFNDDLLSYVEACICCGITMKALDDVKMYRGRNESEFRVKDIRIYNQLIRGLGKEEKSLDLVREVFSYIRQDGLQPNLETYMLCLACVGRLSEKSDYDLMLASFIVKDMMYEGLDVKDIFNQCTFLYNERSYVYRLLTEVIPDYEPNPPMVNVKYTGPLVEPLNEMLPPEEKVEVNPFTCGLSKGEIMKGAEKQFAQELDGFVTLNSVFKTYSKNEEKKMHALAGTQAQWRSNIKKAFLIRKARLRKIAYKTQGISIYPFFCLFPDDDYVDVLCKELHWWLTFSQMFSPTCYALKADLVERVRQRFSIQQMIDVEVFPKLHKAYSAYITRLIDPNTPVQTQRELWKQIMQRITDGNSMERPLVEWSESVRLTLGDIFFDIIVNAATFDVNKLKNKPQKMSRAFFVVERSRDGKQNMELRPHPGISLLVNAQTDLIFPTDKMPSLCPPVPYLGPGQGGNFISTVELVRSCLPSQVELFKEKAEEAGPVLDSLNILSTYAWKVNEKVLDVVLKVFKEGGNEDLEIPVLPENIPKPEKLDQSVPKPEWKAYRKNLFAYKKTLSEATSLWWTSLYKLSIANELRGRTFWLVMNLDFRGRTYPVAPHLHHQNQDYVKALMMFAKGKPLGEEGFKWLKIHLVNLTEHKKRSSLLERLEYADEVMSEILDSADQPLQGNRWWMSAENPWQTLAACQEIAAALRSGDPAMYVSHFPVHQDGSCNGLQHYAAMGRDVAGAKSVNLKCDGSTPADVYSDVVELVKKEIENDIKYNTHNAKIAELCQPYLNRKVIKQSIMTTVYGVTMYGAKLQIKRQLGYKEFPDEHIIAASRYLAEKTFKCLHNLFTSARQIQNWFDQCSVVIGKANQAVEWETPLKFVCIQPYFKTLPQPPDMPEKVYYYLCKKTNRMSVSNVNKQKNGFAPNFVHSLDSVHMMLTSLDCYRKGLTYGSVHDSYWTHACDVDIMSRITREQFIALHSQPILQDLSNYFINRYINRGDLNAEQCAKLRSVFTNVPGKGKFDLNDVLVSPYFFS